MKTQIFSSLIGTFLLSLWGVLFLNSCSFFTDPVVLQINSQQWTSRQFAKLLAQKVHTLHIQNPQDNVRIENLKTQIVGELLMKHLVHQWARDHSIAISERELKQTVKKIQNSYPNDIAFDLYLKRKKIDKKEWKQNIKNHLLNKKVLQRIGTSAKKPSLKEIKSYYQNHPNLFKKRERILIHHIFHKKKEIIIRIQSALRRGESLKMAVRQFIADPRITKAQWVEKGILQVFDQAFSLKKNEISPIWSSSYAYHIIQVLDKKPAQNIPLEEAMPQISQKLLDQRRKALFKKWLDTQSKKAFILKNEEVLSRIKVKLL